MNRLAIYGAGGFGRELISSAKAFVANEASCGRQEWQIVFVDDGAHSASVCGVPVVDLNELGKTDRYLIAISCGNARQRVDAKCKEAGLLPLSLLAPSFEQGPDVSIGEGAIFCSRTMVTASATIGRQFHANIYSYVAHDCIIGDYVTFAPRVSCNGNVHIEDFAYIGTGAIIKQGTPAKPLRIGRGAVVGMGAVVTRDVAPGTVVVGNPARVLEPARVLRLV